MAITDINLSGTVRDDAGSAVNGITVYLLHTAAALNGTQEATDTTDSNGVWNFTETSLDVNYDVKITSGSQNRYIPWSDEIALKTVDTSVLKVRGASNTAAAPIYLFADLATDAGDSWRIQATDSDTLAIGSDKASAGTIIDYITITNGANAAASNTTILGQLTIGVDDTGADVKFFGATSGKYWLWDESADGVVQIGTLTVGVDDTGHDVKFFGATSGQYLLWDESADELVLAGDTKLSFHDAAGGENIIASANGHLEVNAGTTLDITAPTVDLNSSTEFNIDTAIYDLNASGAVTIDAAGLTTITGTNNAVGAIYLRANAGTSETVKIHSDQGTSVTEGAESVTILSDAGGVGIRSTANLAKAVNITSDGGTTGSIAIFNDQGTSVTEGAESISLLSDAGGVGIRSTANLANAVNITADGGTSSTITLFNDQGTTATEGAASIQLLSDAGGINIKSGLNGANAILLTADAGTSETIVIHADQGSGTGSIELLSDAGGIEIDAGTDIILDAGGADIFLKDDGTLFGTLNNNSGELLIKSSSSGTTAATFSGADVTFAGTVDATTDFTIGDTVVTDGVITDSTGLALAANVTVTGNVLPSSDNAYDLGSSGNAWKDLWLQGNITLTDAGKLDTSAGDLTLDAAGNVIISGNFGHVGIGNTSPDLGTGRYVTISGTGNEKAKVVLMNADPSNASAIGEYQFYSGSTNVGAMNMTLDSGSTNSSYMQFYTGASGTPTLAMTIDSAQTVYIGDTANGNMTTGLTINQGAADNEAFAIKSSDVAHGYSGQETDTFFGIAKVSATEGGARINVLSEVTNALWLVAYGDTDNTTKSTSGVGYTAFDHYKDVGTPGTDANLMVIQSGGSTKFIFDAEGSGHADVEWVAFDSYNDLALMDAVQTVAQGRITPERYGDNPLYYHREYLESTGIIGKDSWHDEDGTPRQMVNFTKLSMLHHGAILQIGDSIKSTEDRLLALEVENRELKALIGR